MLRISFKAVLWVEHKVDNDVMVQFTGQTAIKLKISNIPNWKVVYVYMQRFHFVWYSWFLLAGINILPLQWKNKRKDTEIPIRSQRKACQ